MTLPPAARIGYRTFRIEGWPDPPIEKCGSCDNNYAVIRVDERFGEAHAAQTLLHEVLHAAYFNGELHPGDDEEHVVSVFANQLAQVIADNPELIAFLQTALRR